MPYKIHPNWDAYLAKLSFWVLWCPLYPYLCCFSEHLCVPVTTTVFRRVDLYSVIPIQNKSSLRRGVMP